MRALGVDLGERRIGLALSDSEGRVATSHGVLQRAAEPAADHRAIADAARAAGAQTVVVGLPLSLDGSHNAACDRAEAEAEAVARQLGGDVPVVLHDERFTTTVAQRGLAAAGKSTAKKRRARARREQVDAAAAAVLLQGWLDARSIEAARGATS